jgi:hypothetical protein
VIDSLAARVSRRMMSMVQDPDAAFAASSEVSDLLRKMREEIGDIRTRIVGEVWRTEELSLSKLAVRFSFSKTRAAELTQAAEQLWEREEEIKND